MIKPFETPKLVESPLLKAPYAPASQLMVGVPETVKPGPIRFAVTAAAPPPGLITI